MDTLCLKTGIHAAIPVAAGAGPALDARGCCSSSLPSHQQVTAAVTPPKKAAPSFRFSFKYPRLQSLWPPRLVGNSGSGRYNGMALDDPVLVDNTPASSPVVDEAEGTLVGEEHNGNWVLKILHVRSLWTEQGQEQEPEPGNTSNIDAKKDPEKGNDDVAVNLLNEEEEEEEEMECEGCNVDDDDGRGEGNVKRNELDRESFSKLLKRVSLAEAKLYAQMSYLGNLAYCIPRMKAGNLLKRQGLHFVTSSIDKRELAKKSEKNQVPSEDQEPERNNQKEEIEAKQQKNNGYQISASTAYQVAASAASYLHYHTKSILPLKSSKGDSNNKSSPKGVDESNDIVDIMNPEMASLMATTDSVTAVVAAKEEVKQAVADDLSSTRSSPCEWFICDDDQGTRYFVIQGSETLASWQANLLFEPVQFEGLDVPVHRGIYEAAKGMYEQMLPEIRSHLKSHGRHATFRFTGHSLGGSLSLLVNLMLLIRGEVPASSLLPVITFGAPSVMCGGDHLLRKLGLPRSHVQAITMHRDIVPRAFSCNYPNHVAEILKAVNGSFRKHPCLNDQKLLYAPMGELLILQPDEKFSPHHHLLPEGSGLYFLNCPLSDTSAAEKQLRAAQTAFLNSPHPLEILSDHSAYGSGGTIQRDHDMNSYLKCVRNVIRHELNRIRKSRREHRRKFWWSLLAPHGNSGSGIVVGRPVATVNMGQNQFNFSGVLQTGRKSLKRFSRLVASQHMHLLVVLLIPARLFLVGAYRVISFL